MFGSLPLHGVNQNTSHCGAFCPLSLCHKAQVRSVPERVAPLEEAGVGLWRI